MHPGVEASTVDGLRIAFERTGAGPNLVLLPGYVGDGRGTFGPQLDALSDAFTVIAWDNPGSGASDDPPEASTLSDFADWLAALLANLRVDRAHVLGISFGGAVALEFCLRHPTIARSLILAGAYAGWAGSLPPEEVARRLEQALSLADEPPETFVDTVLGSMFSDAVTEDVVEAFALNLRRFHPSGLRTMARAVASADLRDRLAEIEVPTLLLYGSSDVRAPLDVGQAIHASIPGSKLVVLDGVGHVSTLEASERFNSEVRTFLGELAD
jgi:pimeloyl-ACP methyl ester carboxylesterase